MVVVNSRTRARIAAIDLGWAGYKAPVTMLFSPDGRRLWVAATGSSAVAEIDSSGWKIRRRLEAGKGADGLAFSQIDVRPKN